MLNGERGQLGDGGGPAHESQAALQADFVSA